MRTVTEFQKDVLAPLRKERDEKMMATYDRENAIKEAYARERSILVEEKIAFLKKQKDDLEAFKKQQNFDLGTFCNEARTRKSNAFDIYHKGIYTVKQDRRTINETYQDRLGEAFARYNKERTAAGEYPVDYGEARELLYAEREAEQKQETNYDNTDAVGAADK